MTEAVTPVKTPEWMLLLEKKKNRPHRLAHEIGAGAPCLICEEKCPGLDLHFWRKLCRNCKCKKEDHDVKDDDGYEQFEILLGAGSKRKKPGAILKIKVPEVNNGAVRALSDGGSVPFDWVPPNVTEDVAAEYMGQLPPAKLPISGSDGALYRKQQLERQMPLHDLDASRCHNLTPQEIEELQKYLDNLKSNVVGQGRVTKVPTLYTEQRHCYRGPTIEQSSSHQAPLLSSSRSEQSLRSLPPFPHTYNATPRPFLTQVGNDDMPPPLPTSLPPNDTKSNLKTPRSFFSNRKPQNDNGSAVSSEYPLDSTTVSGEFNSKMLEGQYDNITPLDGYKVSSPYPQNVAYSTSVSGQLVTDFSRLKINRDPTGILPQDSIVTSVPGNHGDNSSHIFPNDGSNSYVQYPSDIVHSTQVPGQLAPDKARLLQGRGATAKYSTGSSLLYAQMQDAAEEVAASSSVFPTDSSTVHFPYSQDIASSTAVPGQVISGISHLQQSRGSTAIFPNDGSTLHSNLPQNIASSTAIPGQVFPEISHLQRGRDSAAVFPKYGSVSGRSHLQQGRDSIPIFSQDGSAVSSPYPQDISHSTVLPGQLTPGFSQPHQRSGALLLQDGSLVSSQYPAGITDSNTISDQINSRHTIGNPAILKNPVQSQQLNEPWSVNSQIPASSRHEHSLQPQYDVSVSYDVNGDPMPRSAHIMQQAKPVDNTLASQLNLSAQEQKVEFHLSCQQCKDPLATGDVAVFADRAGDNTAWHPNCFVCKTCKELLVDLIYFFNKGNVYCGRHFAELLNIPRCYACDELIFVKEYTVAEGKTFHVKHFCCYECDVPLAGKQYVPTDDQPTCLDCYQEIFGKRCHTCRKQIAAGERRVGWKELNWHAVEECFCCHGCGKSLLGGRFVMRDEQPFCNKDCVELFASVKQN